MAAFLSAAQLTILVPELLHLLAFAQEGTVRQNELETGRVVS